MKYMGSKNRIAKHILPIMLQNRKENQVWVEPFVGGANMIDKVNGARIGADINPYVIEALKLIRDCPETIPDIITEDDYNNFKISQTLDGITGFVGFAMSFGGKWFGGYRRDVAGTKGCIDNMQTQTRRSKQSAIQQSKLLQDVIFLNVGYMDLNIPKNSIIYCDPPYKDTTKYSNINFNHGDFFQWCRDMSYIGHKVFISEYTAPDDFECVWRGELRNGFKKQSICVEKLFTYNHVQGETK